MTTWSRHARLGPLRHAVVPWVAGWFGVALILAAATPATLVTGAEHWRSAGYDEIARRVTASYSLEDLGAVVTAEAAFGGGDLEAVDAAIRARMGEVAHLAEPTLTLYTGRLRIAVGAGEELEFVRTPGRLIAVDALRSGVTLAAGSGAEAGAFVSSWLAEREGLVPGDVISVFDDLNPTEALEDRSEPIELTIAGVYETPWTEDNAPPTGVWADIPNFLFPRYQGPFVAPDSSPVLLTEATMSELALPGWSRWDSPALDRPDSSSELRLRERSVRAVERDLVRSGALRDLLAGVSPGQPVVDLDSSLPEAADEAAGLSQAMDEPLNAARMAGVVVGVAVFVGGAAAHVGARRRSYRLLAGEGRQWDRLALDALPGLAVVATLGLIVGVLAGRSVAVLVGPAQSPEWFGGLVPAMVVTVISIVLAAVAVGLGAQQTLDDGTLGRRGIWGHVLAAVLLSLAMLAWVDVGGTPPGGSVDVVAVAFPLVVLAGAAAVATYLLAGMGRIGAIDQLTRSRVVATMAWRRGTAGGPSRLLSAVLAVGLGLVGVSVILIDALDEAARAKVATTVGGNANLELFGQVPRALDLPPQTTIVWTQSFRSVPGQAPVRVVALDPATVADGVTWPEEFGLDLPTVLAILNQPTGGVPAMQVEGGDLDRVGAFGGTFTTPYEIVGTVRSAPMATGFGSTLVVSAEALDERALDAARAAAGGVEADVVAEFRSPLLRYRPHLITQGDPQALVEFAAANSFGTRDLVTAEEGILGSRFLATRFAFDYQRVLGVVAALAAFAALAQHLALQRRRRALARLMTRQMGLSAGRAAWMTAGEIALIITVAALGVGAAAPAVAQRLFDRFEPASSEPPDIVLEIGWLPMAAAAVLVVLVTTATVLMLERVAARSDSGEVMRDVG